jgi:hypothetical protein
MISPRPQRPGVVRRTLTHGRRPTSRDFVPWRFSDAGRRAVGLAHPAGVRKPAQEQTPGRFTGRVATRHVGSLARRLSSLRSGRWPRGIAPKAQTVRQATIGRSITEKAPRDRPLRADAAGAARRGVASGPGRAGPTFAQGGLGPSHRPKVPVPLLLLGEQHTGQSIA